MKIYWLIQQLDFIGGTEMVTSNIINQLSDHYDITVISTASIKESKYHFNEKVKIMSLNVPIDLCRSDYYYKKYTSGKNILKFLGLTLRICAYYIIGIRRDRRVLKKITTKEDLIIASSADGYLLAPRGRKVAYHFHFNAKYFLSFSNFLLRRMIRKPDYYFFLTETTYNTIIKKRPKAAKKEITYIYNPVRLSPCLSHQFHNHKLVFLARFLPQKDPMLALKVAYELQRRNFPFELHFYGEGDFLKSMKTYIEKNKLASFVFLHPMTNDVTGVLNSADLLLVTSNFEGLPLVTVEANSQSVPVITSNWGDACHEVVHNGENGYVIETRNPEDFAEKIIEVLSNKDAYQNLRVSSYESSKRFAMDEISKKWCALLDKINKEKI